MNNTIKESVDFRNNFLFTKLFYNKNRYFSSSKTVWTNKGNPCNTMYRKGFDVILKSKLIFLYVNTLFDSFSVLFMIKSFVFVSRLKAYVNSQTS